MAWDAIPQYTVGHADRTAALAAAVRAAFGRHADVIGNSFHGVGVADSLAHGLAAGRAAAGRLQALAQARAPRAQGAEEGREMGRA